MRSLAALAVVLMASGADQGEQFVKPVLSTAPLYNYEGAPATPDADDPAIWVNHENPQKSLVIGTAKDAGLLVYTLKGTLVQAPLPPNAPQILDADPATPGGVNTAPDNPCTDSESGETFGRYNNVDIAYDVRIGKRARETVDVAIVSDRGCDRVRFFKIDPSDPEGPLALRRVRDDRTLQNPADPEPALARRRESQPVDRAAHDVRTSVSSDT